MGAHNGERIFIGVNHPDIAHGDTVTILENSWRRNQPKTLVRTRDGHEVGVNSGRLRRLHNHDTNEVDFRLMMKILAYRRT